MFALIIVLLPDAVRVTSATTTATTWRSKGSSVFFLLVLPQCQFRVVMRSR